VTPAEAPGGPAAERHPYVSATVVHVQRPTSARPGDSAVIHPDGQIDGFVGGVCAESTVRVHALQAMSTGEPVLLRILPGDADQTSPNEDGMVTVQNPCLSGGALQIFLEPHLPAPRLTVFGDAPAARAVADLGRRMGYEVSESEDGEGQLPPETSAVVVASLGRFDEPSILRAVAAGVPYIGLVASPKRGGAIVAGLELPPEDRERVHTPAGLDIGARTPHEVALSIFAEIISLRGSHRPAALFHQDEPGAAEAPIAATAVDPVCGMTVATVEASLHLEDDGRVVWFCSEGCMRTYSDRGASVRSGS
jgi:xanthine dehydrogenase accessory factor